MIYRLELKKNRKSLIIWTLILSILFVLFFSVYPMMTEEGMKDIMATKIHTLPPSVLKMFGIESQANLTDISQYLAYVSNYILIAMAVYGVGLGQKSLVREEVQGTIEYLYSKPISRTRIYFGKFFSGITNILVIYIIIQIVLFGMYFYLDKKIIGKDYIINMIEIISAIPFVSIFFFCFGTMISSFMNRDTGENPIGLGIVFFTFFLGLFTQLMEKFGDFIYISPIEVFKGGRILSGKTNLTEIGIYSGVMLLFVIVGWIRYRRKNFLV